MPNLRLSTLLTTLFFVAGLSSVVKRYNNAEDMLMRLRALKREPQLIYAQCAGPAGRCFSTAHCCGGLICATFDEEMGEKPEVPGSCVKSKDLQGCSTDRQSCPSGMDCVPLGRQGQRYCVHQDTETADTQEQDRSLGPQGGLGNPCTTTKDCNPTTLDGTMRLCCQKVRLGRQAAKSLCDRVTAISDCIDTP